jgi:hypothetical protein
VDARAHESDLRRLDVGDGPVVIAAGDGEGCQGIGVFAEDDLGLGVNPVLQIVKRMAALPCGVRGPVDFRALRRLAAI